MNTTEILNLIAIITIPIVAVLVGQWLQNRSEKRKDKMQIFKTLMTARIYGWTVDSVHALNIIDIVFAEDEKVRNAWKNLYEKYCVENPTQTQLEQIKTAQYKLLEEISNSLGYKDKITWENIQNPYIPNGLVQQWQQQAQSQQTYNSLLNNIVNIIPQNRESEDKQ